MEYVLKMIMSPFWREVKWRKYGGMAEFTGIGGLAPEPVGAEESRTREN